MEERDEDNKECPMCASRNTSYSEREKSWVCRDCGSVIGGTPIVLEKPREEVVREILPNSIVRKKEAIVAKAAKKLAKKKGTVAKKSAKKPVKKKTAVKSKSKSPKKSAKKPVKKNFMKRLLSRK